MICNFGTTCRVLVNLLTLCLLIKPCKFSVCYSPCSCLRSNGAKDLAKTSLDRCSSCDYLFTAYLEVVHIYIYIYIFRENTLGECRINILKIERRKRGTTGEKKK